MTDREVFYENERVAYQVAHAERIFEVIWKDASFLTEYEFKELMLKQKEWVAYCQPQCILIDSTYFNFTIDPELQKWFDDQIFPVMLDLSVQKIGIVVSQDMFAQVSVEQTMQEGTGIMLQTRYFQTYEDARFWLLNL